MKPRHCFGIFSIFVSMSLPLAAQSTYVAGTGNWSTAANWNPAAVPASGTNIILSDGSVAAGTLTLDGTTSRIIGSYTHGTTGTRTSEFTLQTGTNTLTVGGGVIANGNFTGIGLRVRGNTVISANQAWSVGGNAGAVATDTGVLVQDRLAATRGVFTLNGTITKSGTGQLGFAGATVDGPGDIVINEGSLKLNAGSSLELRATGTGKFILNNTSSLFFSKNSGTFGDSTTFNRAFQFNGTSNVATGGNVTAGGPWVIPSNMEWNGTHTITLANSTGTGTPNLNYDFGGVMSGSGALTKLGASQLFFSGSGSNTLSGLVTVTAGELRLAKTAATAIAGDILVNGGILRMDQPNQIADTSNITVTSGQFIDVSGQADTIASLSISSGALSSLSAINVTGATTITNGSHDVNSSYTFSTNSLAISNNAALRLGGNTAASTVNVGAGGLTLNNGNLTYGSPGGAFNMQLNLSGNLTSSGISQFSPANYNGTRVIDLQAGSRSFAVNDGTLDIRTTVQNGTLVKSGDGLLRLSRGGSTADFSFIAGPVQIVSQIDGANVALSGGSLLMDLGGATPAKVVASGNFTGTGGTIEISAANGAIAPGNLELVRYGGTLTGTPTINIPPQLAGSRMNPVVDYGSGTNSSISLISSAVPLGLVWQGATGGLWDNTLTANFNGGAEKFYPLDSVIFDDTGANPSIVLNSSVFPTDVSFDHGGGRPTYTLTGSGGISGPTKLTKNGTGKTIIATDNSYTGVTSVLGGTLQVGNSGSTGNLGTGGVFVDFGTTLEFARTGSATFGNVITGTGAVLNSGTGTVALTANSDAFAGEIRITKGALQLGDGGTSGSIGVAPITISAGATFAVKRSDTPTISNNLVGGGALAIVGGTPIINGFNTHTGGVAVSDAGTLRVSSDSALGDLPPATILNSIRLNFGGLKNQDSDTLTDASRGITITGEAYLTAGWTKTLSIGGPITGSGNLFINYDSGKVLLTNPSSDWNGVLTLGANKPGFTGTTGGILEIAAITNGGVAGPLGKASADPANLVFNGGRLIYNGDAGSTDRGFTLQNSATIEVVSSTLALNGKATGTGTLTKAGIGTLILGGSSDFVGEKVISNGTLVVQSVNALGDTVSNVRFTGTTGILDLATDTSVAPHTLTTGAGNSGTILSNVATPGLGINHQLGDFALSTVTISVGAGANVSGGDPRITIPNLGLSAGASGTTTLNPTTAGITVGTATITNFNFAKTLALGGTSQNNVVTGPISDGLNVLGLTKVNDSLWTLSGDSNFTGNVTVDDGILAITHSNALGTPATKTLVIAGDAGNNRIPELRVSGGISSTIANLNISGAGVGNAAGALRNISGDNTVNVTAQVTMRTGNGNTTLYSDAGTLTLNTPLVTANATARALTLGGPGNGVINGVIANGSTVNLPVTKSGTGKWKLNGAHTYSGATAVNEGVLSFGQAALNDTAAVTIAAGATLNLDFTGIDQVGSLTIDGVAKPDGVYSVATDPGFITGTGSIRVGQGTQGYSTWASAYPFTAGVNDGPTADPDGDGISNLLEYVLGGVPVGAGAGNPSILPSQALTDSNLVLTFKRSDISEADVTLRVQWSDNLVTWQNFATIGPVDALPAVDVTEDSPNVDLDNVVVTIPRSTAQGGKIFARLQAVK